MNDTRDEPGWLIDTVAEFARSLARGRTGSLLGAGALILVLGLILEVLTPSTGDGRKRDSLILLGVGVITAVVGFRIWLAFEAYKRRSPVPLLGTLVIYRFIVVLPVVGITVIAMAIGVAVGLIRFTG